MSKVIFVGAGPGDPELITIKGSKALAEADVIIYAGSLVNPEILKISKAEASIHDSASLTLEEVIQLMEKAVKAGKNVVRLHTGDPSIYGAIQEQMHELDKRGIKYSIVPGVSSVFAAAASIKREFTLPGISQTLILTRLSGRTPVPELEDLKNLAKHQASMAIFLSVQDIGTVVNNLLSGYSIDTPVAVVYRASWSDEIVLRGTLKTIEAQVKEAGIRKQAQILIGNFLNTEFERSKLYDPTFSHEFREGKRP